MLYSEIHVPNANKPYKNISIKSASDLKYLYEQFNPNGYFFTRKTMSFFGDTMKNYGIKHHKNMIELYRKSPVKGGQISSTFFDIATFDTMHNEIEIEKRLND